MRRMGFRGSGPWRTMVAPLPPFSIFPAMDTTVTIVLPVFGLILLGYLVGLTRLFSDEGVKGLTNFVFYIAMPCLLFRAMARLDRPENFDLSILLAYFSSAFFVYLIGWLIGRYVFRNDGGDQAMLGMAGVFSNTALVGLPVTYAAFGEKGLLPLLIILSLHPVLLITLPTILIELHRGRGDRWQAILGSTCLSLVKNPVIVAMLAGLAYGQTGLGLPDVVDRFARFVGGAGPPAALFAVGASLTAYKIAGDLREVSVAILLKLSLLPVTVFVMTTYVFALDPLWAAVATINAAMPVGVNVFVLARHYDIFVARAASAVLLSTGVAWITVALLLTAFGDVAAP